MKNPHFNRLMYHSNHHKKEPVELKKTTRMVQAMTLICDKEEIERKIARVHVEKLLQADNTQLQMEPLQTHFGEDGDFNKWDDIASGTLRLPDRVQVDKGVQIWFKKIQSTEYTEQKTEWTSDDYCDSWKKWMKELHHSQVQCLAISKRLRKEALHQKCIPFWPSFPW